MTERDRAKRRLQRRCAKLLADSEQAVRDIQWWNAHRTEHPPEDCEWFQVQAAGLRKALGALERDEPIDPAWIQLS